ncbi:MAG: nucleotidyltransferase domain-containing protein [Chloroflexi bacterium]|nr:nucleotidyltransferase domain-containing protein [Chloroflexota bacterium]
MPPRRPASRNSTPPRDGPRRLRSRRLDPIFARLARAFFKRYPRLKALAFYGSRAAGLGSRRSDYDVMLFLSGGLDWNERYEAAEQIGRRFGVKLEVNVASPRSVEWHYRLFPDFRFLLRDAIIFGDGRIVNGHRDLPPVAKEGLWDSVIESEIYQETAQAHRDDSAWCAEWYFRALRKVVIAESVIEGQYSQQYFRQRLIELLGGPLARKMNRPSARFSHQQIAHLEQVTRGKIAEIKERVASLAKNESDRFLAELRAKQRN